MSFLDWIFKPTGELERKRFKLIVDSMGEGLLVVDGEKRLTVINPVAEKLLEVKSSGVLGKSWSEVVTTLKDGQPVPEGERSIAVCLKLGETVVTNLKDGHYYKTMSGRVFPVVSITAPLVMAKGVEGVVKVFRDATIDEEAKKMIEEKVEERTKELREEKARLGASIESLSLGFVMTDAAGQIILTNKSVAKILQCSPKGPDWTVGEIQNCLGGLDLVMESRKCLESGKPVELKEVVVGAKYLHVYLAPVLEIVGEKEAIGVVILIEDVTEEKVLDRSKDEFFTIASHELRTPLTSIRGNTAMILENYLRDIKDPQFKEMLQDTHESALRLIKIVNQFLDLSRLEQGRIEFKLEKIDLCEIIQKTLVELKDAAAKKKIKLISKLDSEIFVKADSIRVREVLVNLIDNAIKFTDKGKVTVSASGSRFVQVEIADSGRGVSLKDQSLLFRKLQQAGPSLYTRDIAGGAGLGLYISKLMVEGMGGKIWLVSTQENKGSVFAFTLPIA